MSTKTYFKEYALSLHQKGYEPIPIRTSGAGKGNAPFHTGWQMMAITEEVIAKWIENDCADCNVGLRTGRMRGDGMIQTKNPALVASTTGVSRGITLRHNYNITPEVQRQALSVCSD
jgi:hypothetical protein